MIHGDDDMHDAENIKRTNRVRHIPHTFFPMTNVLYTTLRESRIVMTLRSGKWEIKWTSICEFWEHDDNDKNVQVLFMIHVTCVWLFQSFSSSHSLSMIWSSLNMTLILFLYSPSRNPNFLSYINLIKQLIFSINQKRT